MTLQEKLNQKVLRQQEIVNAAKSAMRSFSAEEQKEFDALQKDIEALKIEIANEEKSSQNEAQKIIAAERTRVADISGLCREFEIDPAEHIKSGASVDAVRTAILNRLKDERKASPASAADVSVTAEETDKFRAAASDALLIRAGRNPEKPAEGARDLRGMKLRDLAIDCLSRAGITGAHRMTDEDLFRAALTPDSQFASILSNAVNKSMATAYRAAQTTYQRWTGRGSNPDFKGATHYQISEAGDLQQMTQSGEFKFDEMSDQGVNKAIATFGRSFGMTRQAFINDDLGILTRVPEAYVRAAGRGINRLVYQILGNNPVIFDGAQLFNNAALPVNHNNLGVAANIAVPSVSLGRTAMRTQRNLRGNEILNIGPRFLIVPATRETEAQQFVSTALVPTAQNVINPFAGTLEIVADAELDALRVAPAAFPWFLAASPADIDTIEVTYLNGDDMPKLESQVGFEYLGIKWRIYIDYGVTVLDYRGVFMNPGL